MGITRKTSADLVTLVRAIAEQEQESPRALFTILAGAGLSVGAGMPSTSILVSTMSAQKRRLEKREGAGVWGELLTQAAASETREQPSASVAATYQDLFNDPILFPSPLHRQRFISEAIVWGAGRGPGFSRESLLLSSILLAGSGRRVERQTAPKQPSFGNWLVHTVYTTNFDEVIPQTLRYCGEPVVVVDHPGAHGRLHGEPHYPRVGYLHGCHLHYSLRNTPSEIARPEADRTGGVDLPGLFLRFRDVLRSTGLIVLGYSGWDDRAVRAIGDALADGESLPFGLYWGARYGESSLSHTALSLLRQHSDRAFLLDDGQDAFHTLDHLCANLGVNHSGNLATWHPRIVRVSEQFANFVAPTAPVVPSTPEAGATGPADQTPQLQRDFEQSQLVEEGNRLFASYNGKLVKDWIARAKIALASSRASKADPSPQLISYLGSFQRMVWDLDGALKSFDEALQHFQALGWELWVASTLLEKAEALSWLNRLDEAGQMARAAEARSRAFGDADGVVTAIATIVNIALRGGQMAVAAAAIDSPCVELERASSNARSRYFDTAAAVALRRGLDELSEKLAMQALEATDNPIGRTNALLSVGDAALFRGAFARARTRYEETQAVGLERADSVTESAAERRLGDLAMREEHFEEAQGYYRRLLEREVGAPSHDAPLIASTRVKLAEAEAASRLPGDHAKSAADALTRLENMGRPFSTYLARLSLARIEAYSARYEAAETLAVAVRDQAHAAGELLVEREANATLAKIAALRARN